MESRLGAAGQGRAEGPHLEDRLAQRAQRATAVQEDALQPRASLAREELDKGHRVCEIARAIRVRSGHGEIAARSRRGHGWWHIK